MKKLCYCLVDDRGEFITTDAKLPIYWNRAVATEKAERFNARIQVVPILKIYQAFE